MHFTRDFRNKIRIIIEDKGQKDLEKASGEPAKRFVFGKVGNLLLDFHCSVYF